MIESSRAYQYAKWCTQRSNQKVGRYVKLQAKAWLKIADGKHKEAYVSEPAYRKICRLLGLMVHPDLHCTMDKGLEDYAWFLIVAVFCTLRREDDRRFYETALLEIARKNFKTFNSAVIFIIGLLTEPRFSRFFSVAPDYKLSSELRLAVRKIIKVSPALVKHFKVTRDMITCLVTETEYMPLAYSNDGMDGRLANIFLADEAGALDSYPVEAMRSSQITLANKLGIIISTQYPNDNNVLTDEIDIAKKVLDRVLDRENVFSLLYEPDDALRKQWETNDLVLYQANPVAVNNAGVLRAIKDLRSMAVLYENKRENFLCKHCNIMYKGLGVEGYIDTQKVMQCRRREDLSFWSGRRVWVGLDLAQSDDNTAVRQPDRGCAGGHPRGHVGHLRPPDGADRRDAPLHTGTGGGHQSGQANPDPRRRQGQDRPGRQLPDHHPRHGEGGLEQDQDRGGDGSPHLLSAHHHPGPVCGPVRQHLRQQVRPGDRHPDLPGRAGGPGGALLRGELGGDRRGGSRKVDALPGH